MSISVPRQALRYAVLGFVSLAAIALSESILQSRASLYLAFEPTAFLRELPALLAMLAGLAALGGVLDRPDRSRRMALVARCVLITLLYLALFQIFRRALGANLTLVAVTKAACMLGCLIAAALTVWQLRIENQWRVATATAVALVAMFALQPGMPGYLAHSLHIDGPGLAPPVTTAVPARRTFVMILDEWDMELTRRSGLFEREPLQGLLAQGFSAEQAVPAGPQTLSSIPGMLKGQRFGNSATGGPGWLESGDGQRFDAANAGLFSDLPARGLPFSVVGFYHDYCALAIAARSCSAEPVQFFAGWWSVLARSVTRGQEFDYPYSDFLKQWSGTYARLRAQTLAAAADRSSTVVWAHLNVPHPPIATANGRARSLAADYDANLALLPALIEEVRTLLVRTDPDSVLVLTSDHWLREKELWSAIYERQRGPGSGQAGKSGDRHVPFIVWFGGAAAHEGVRYAAPMATTAMRELVPALALRRINTPAEVAAFMQGRGPRDTEPFPDRSGGAGVH